MKRPLYMNRMSKSYRKQRERKNEMKGKNFAGNKEIVVEAGSTDERQFLHTFLRCSCPFCSFQSKKETEPKRFLRTAFSISGLLFFLTTFMQHNTYFYEKLRI